MAAATDPVRTYKLSMDGGAGFLLVDASGFDAIVAEISNADPGTKFHVEVVDTPRAEFEALPEFDGF